MTRMPESIRCDGCGKNRIDDCNHWRSFNAGEEYFHISSEPDNTDEFHVCGDACASKLFARWLATGKVTE